METDSSPSAKVVQLLEIDVEIAAVIEDAVQQVIQKARLHTRTEVETRAYVEHRDGPR